jgi:hypothetical protein
VWETVSRHKLRVSISHIVKTKWCSDKLLSYLPGVLNVEVFEIYDRIRGQEKVNLQEDGVATDLCRHSAGGPEALEIRLVMFVSKL